MKNKFNLLIYGTSLVLLGLIIHSLFNKYIINDKHQARDLNQTVVLNSYDIVYGDSLSSERVYMYFSYKCGYCKRFFKEVFPKLKTNYIDNGKLQLVLKLVEDNQDQDMLYALQIGIGLFQFGEYEPFHLLFMHDSKVVYTDDFKDLCADILSSNSELAQYILEDNALKAIKRNYQEYEELNLTGTPSFIIKEKLYKGYLEYSEFKEILED